MRSSFNSLWLLLASAAISWSSPTEDKTRKNVAAASDSSAASLLAAMADSQIRHGVPAGIDYATGVMYNGLEDAIMLSENQTLADYYKAQIDSFVEDDGTIKTFNYTYYSLDNYRIGNNILWWYQRILAADGESEAEKYRLAADGIRSLLHLTPRNKAGGFWHRSPTYPYQMWGDGIFMADSFYARYTALFQPDNTTAWDDIVLQYDLYFNHTRNDTLKLTNHGYDESKAQVWADPVTGSSPLVWDRADGWFYSSLLEVIPVWPETHPGLERLQGYFTYLSEGLLNAQDEEGGWWLIMNPEYVGVEGNYIESSATAMFAHGFLGGIQLGLIDSDTYLAPALKAWDLMVSDWVVENDDGTLDWEDTVIVGSLGSDATFEYYISQEVDENDLKGIGPFMWTAYLVASMGLE